MSFAIASGALLSFLDSGKHGKERSPMPAGGLSRTIGVSTLSSLRAASTAVDISSLKVWNGSLVILSVHPESQYCGDASEGLHEQSSLLGLAGDELHLGVVLGGHLVQLADEIVDLIDFHDRAALAAFDVLRGILRHGFLLCAARGTC